MILIGLVILLCLVLNGDVSHDRSRKPDAYRPRRGGWRL